MAWNPKYRIEIFEGGKVMGLIITEPYWPVALRTDDGHVVFAGIEGERSDPIPIQKGVEEFAWQMLWLSEGAQFAISVPSGGWVSPYGTPIDPEPRDGERRILSVYRPCNYGGGSDLSKVVFSTVLREKDLPLRRDERGTWTALGHLLPGTEEIPYWMDFEVENKERAGEERLIKIARLGYRKD